MLLGDFNAGCSYLPKKYRKDIRLLTDSRFEWLINHTTDTTVRESTACAYDRSATAAHTHTHTHLRGPDLTSDLPESRTVSTLALKIVFMLSGVSTGSLSTATRSPEPSCLILPDPSSSRTNTSSLRSR